MADANIIKEEKEEALADYKKRRQLRKKADTEEQAASKEEQKVQESKEQAKDTKEGSEEKESKERKEKKLRKIETAEQLLFGKYSFSDVVVSDASLADYIVLTPMKYPNTFGRRKNKSYYFSHVNVVERLMNKLMRGGTGKKVGGKVIRTKVGCRERR